MLKDNGTSVYFDRETFSFVGLDDAKIKQLTEAYPLVNVNAELKKMGLWLNSPKGKIRKGEMSFIMNWLQNAPPSPVNGQPRSDYIAELHHPLRPLLNEYLKDLWKGREHILELNTIHKKS